MKKNIAILYVATGRYTIFWDKFYRSMERFFLTEHQKTYFFFTDDESLPLGPNVVKIPQENLGWPGNTLMRFDMFLKIEGQLRQFDYIYFLNGNAEIFQPMGEEIFPSREQGLMVVQHPWFYYKSREEFTYETNPLSLAHIPADKGKIYVMGGFNGGTAEAFLQMCRSLDANTKKDWAQGIVALWHDESHLNRYILDKSPLVLAPDRGIMFEGLEEETGLQGAPLVMLFRDKNNHKYGGLKWLRGDTDKKQNIVYGYTKLVFKKILTKKGFNILRGALKKLVP